MESSSPSNHIMEKNSVQKILNIKVLIQLLKLYNLQLVIQILLDLLRSTIEKINNYLYVNK